MDIVLATNNLGKIREFRTIFKEQKEVDLLSLRDFSHYTPPSESGKTFEENALLKAVHAARTLAKWAVADDSGLVVPALNNAPGVYSARYSGEGATESKNRAKLLREMQGLQAEQRYAYFECCLVLANADGYKKTVRGICEGWISDEERGCHGFGYDSLFVKHDYDKTFAELDESIKNRISHRRKAIDKLLIALEHIMREEKLSSQI
ncbi:XTP/dITP diphosphatase [Simkania negevensis]|uniref:dITP/XTP pyrophosphatase n=1 Tax=Simkania negevensis TaxID=83561 RepID=A0ABS3ATE9_9BACT|nr:XTP/dITP diphosphatase [Simkania negevensis]